MRKVIGLVIKNTSSKEIRIPGVSGVTLRPGRSWPCHPNCVDQRGVARVRGLAVEKVYAPEDAPPRPSAVPVAPPVIVVEEERAEVPLRVDVDDLLNATREIDDDHGHGPDDAPIIGASEEAPVPETPPKKRGRRRGRRGGE